MLEGLRVLVVDDNSDSRELLIVILEVYGAQVTALASAEAVLETIAKLRPNLLISDLQMPEDDGFTLIKQIRSLPSEQGGQTLAIALSGSAHQGRDMAITCGFQRFILKPIDPEQLIEVIRSLLSEAS